MRKASASRDQIRIALALEVGRARVGRYPDRLEQLDQEPLGAMPRDPLSGDLFRYRKFGDGYDLLDAGFEGEFDPTGDEGVAIRVRRAGPDTAGRDTHPTPR